MTKEKFTVTGMSCSACSAGVERVTKKLNGVKSAEVSLLGESLSVEYDETLVKREDIFAAVTALGYGIGEYREGKEERQKGKTEALKKRFIVSIILLVPLMYLAMGGMFSFPQPPAVANYILQFVLAGATMAVNFRFFKNGFSALVKRVPNMDTLVSLGSGVSFLYSTYQAIKMGAMGGEHAGHLFFESAAMILTLVTLGKWLESAATGKTGREVEKLLRMMPDTVRVVENDEEKTVPFSSLKEGDILAVKQGDYIPVDGVVVSGGGFVDRAAVTGESVPVEAEVGSQVTGADIVKSGYMRVRAEKVGKDTTISQIVRMVKEAGESKAPIQHTADVIAGIFVPAVTLIALVTFLVWLLIKGDVSAAANYAISVLVISCPCSLGLATPVAVMAATGKGMSLGILFKNAETLQRAEKVNCVLLDKTATLTEGNMKTTDFEAIPGGANVADEAKKRGILRIAAAIEAKSNHPIADCIYEYAVEKAGEPTFAAENYAYETGKGARAEVGGKIYRLGNRKLLTEAENKLAFEEEKRLSKQGKTAVFLAGESGLIAVFAEALPKDKADAVKRVQSAGGYVAMVGDGINDSPALKQADVGIAVGTGTDVAIDSADVVLASGDIRSVADAVNLSRKTVKNIKENLFWAFFYNVIAIPVAAGAFAFAGISLNPMIASACMSLSSLFVVGNALRLTRFKSGFQGAKNAAETGKENTLPKENTEMKKVLHIEGMMCAHCVKHVTDALNALDGVNVLTVDLKKKIAEVSLEKETSDETLKKAIADAGYELKKIDD